MFFASQIIYHNDTINMLNPGKHKQHMIQKESKQLDWKNESNLYM